MANLSRDEIITIARAELHEPRDGRYYKNDPEMFGWLHLAQDEVAQRLEYAKKPLSFLGNDATYYLSALGTAPRYYKLPADFMMIDLNFGINFNGIRRMGFSDRELDAFQPKAIAALGTNPATSSVLQVDDYFTLNFNGVLAHYAVNFVIDDPAYGTGYVMWFVPNPVDTTQINLRYIPLPDQFASASDAPVIMRQFQELLVFGLIKRAIRKKKVDGLVAMNDVQMYDDLFEKMLGEAQDFMKRKTPDKLYRIKTARQIDGAYNSAKLRRRNFGITTE